MDAAAMVQGHGGGGSADASPSGPAFLKAAPALFPLLVPPPHPHRSRHSIPALRCHPIAALRDARRASDAVRCGPVTGRTAAMRSLFFCASSVLLRGPGFLLPKATRGAAMARRGWTDHITFRWGVKEGTGRGKACFCERAAPGRKWGPTSGRWPLPARDFSMVIIGPLKAGIVVTDFDSPFEKGYSLRC